MKKWTLLIVLTGLLVAGGIAGAQTSPSFDLSWSVLAGGGERVASTNHTLDGTLGQGAVGLSDSTSFELQSGYWYAVSSLSRHSVYLPVVLRRSP
ncbi:MAG: hypothetical protein PVH11_03525 [Anaerolineae bacterium]|jgi:hypothetical protein